MTADELAAYAPRLFHMAEAGSWESIRRHGLLSTTALLDRWEISGEARVPFESARRAEAMALHHPAHGTAVLRDQKPMSDDKLRACLVEMEPREWYESLNRKVFFWLSPERLDVLFHAKFNRGQTHLVLTLDTQALLDRHGDRVRLSPINSGATLYNPPARGAHTFLPIADYPFAEQRRRRGRAGAIAELTVDYAVPDVADFVLTAEHRTGDTREIVWTREMTV